MKKNEDLKFLDMVQILKGECSHSWVNMGGQLISEQSVDKLRQNIVSGKISSWETIHSEYNRLYEKYKIDKQKHAFSIFELLAGSDSLTVDIWLSFLDKAVDIQEFINKQVFSTRKKDFDNPFRKNTYRNSEEMDAAIGSINDNGFVKEIGNQTELFRNVVLGLKSREI